MRSPSRAEWPARRGRPEALPRSCRILIVGAGLAGLETAKELDRAGVDDVVVVESGPVGDARHNNTVYPPGEALRHWLVPQADDHFSRPYVSLTPPHYTGPSGLRRRLGGRSLYWYGVCLPIEEWALADPAWPGTVSADLRVAWRGAAPLYQRVCRQLADWCGPGHTFGSAAPSGSVAGLSLRPTPMAVRRHPGQRDRWHAYSPLDAWRDPLSGLPGRRGTGFRLFTGLEVLSVLARGGRARGVIMRDTATRETITLRAETVVLAAGTLESSRLAIQALALSDAAGGGARLHGLADHIVQGFLLQLPTAPAGRLLGQLSLGDHYAPCAPEHRSNVFFAISAGADGGVLVDVRATGEQLPDARTWVEWKIAAEPPWPARVHATPSDADRLLIAGQRAILQDIFDDIARITGIQARRLDFGVFDSPERTNACVLPDTIEAAAPGSPVTWSSFLGVEDHEGGTLPLGGLLDDRHEFLAVPGLFAAGPATFPRPGAANPSLTTLALAHRLAAELSGRTPAEAGA